MSEQYRLVFSGEVLEGQHAAVVKKRLAAILKLDDEKMDVLFSGNSVVVKNATDEKNAARYQAAFQKAGARLRVLPAEEGEQNNTAEQTPPTPKDDAPSEAGGLALTPQGTDVLSEDERPAIAAVEVDTDHLEVQAGEVTTHEAAESTIGPDVDHLTLAELGALLGNAQAQETVVQELDVEFDLAAVGTILGNLDETGEIPPIPTPDFELAEPGVELDTRTKAPPPSAPDTSHLQLDKDDTDETT